MWLDPRTAMIGLGLRTNEEAASQIATTLEEIGVETIAVDMPYGTMHFMGMLRIVARDLAIAWPRRTPFAAVRALQERGCEIVRSEEHTSELPTLMRISFAVFCLKKNNTNNNVPHN